MKIIKDLLVIPKFEVYKHSLPRAYFLERNSGKYKNETLRVEKSLP